MADYHLYGNGNERLLHGMASLNLSMEDFLLIVTIASRYKNILLKCGEN